MDRIHQTLTESLERLAKDLDRGQSAELTAYLKTLGRFHRYSLNNQLLIWGQRPDATRVAGFAAWKRLHRHVKPGERGIMIMAPVTRRRDAESEATERSDHKDTEPTAWRFKPAYVFDVSQTEGQDLPTAPGVTGNPGVYAARLAQLVRDCGVELHYELLPPGLSGMSEGGRITVCATLDGAEEFSTTVHELAHEILHRGRTGKSRTVRECEAEAVAFAVCHAVGLEVGTASSDYIGMYDGTAATLTESLGAIRDTAARILAVLLPAEEG